MGEVRLIDANALVALISEINSTDYGSIFDYVAHGTAREALHDAIRLIEQMPTIEAEPVRHGRWIDSDPIGIYRSYECSECQGIVSRATPDYCPYCGAKMDGGESDA